MSEKIIKWGFIGCGEVTKKKKRPGISEGRGFGSRGRDEP